MGLAPVALRKPLRVASTFVVAGIRDNLKIARQEHRGTERGARVASGIPIP